MSRRATPFVWDGEDVPVPLGELNAAESTETEGPEAAAVGMQTAGPTGSDEEESTHAEVVSALFGARRLRFVIGLLCLAAFAHGWFQGSGPESCDAAHCISDQPTHDLREEQRR